MLPAENVKPDKMLPVMVQMLPRGKGNLKPNVLVSGFIRKNVIQLMPDKIWSTNLTTIITAYVINDIQLITNDKGTEQMETINGTYIYHRDYGMRAWKLELHWLHKVYFSYIDTDLSLLLEKNLNQIHLQVVYNNCPQVKNNDETQPRFHYQFLIFETSFKTQLEDLVSMLNKSQKYADWNIMLQKKKYNINLQIPNVLWYDIHNGHEFSQLSKCCSQKWHT